MSNEIRSIASVHGLFGRELVSLYNESDLMKQAGVDRYGKPWFIMEEFEVQKEVNGKMGKYALGLSVNSYPFFCRYDLYEPSNETPRETWLKGLCPCNSVHDEMKNVAKYDRICPKCGWGVSAYLAIRCRYDERFGVCYYDRKGDETNQHSIFKAYLDICRTIYEAIHYDEYTHYKAIGDVEAINSLEADFISQHRKAEEQYRNDSGEVDRMFFAGQLAKVVGEYLDYISGVEAIHQQADRWVIDEDVTLRVFGGERAKAVEYLTAVIGHGYSAIEYGRETRRLKIDIPFRYAKQLWKMICANDTNQSDKGYSQFNKGRI